MALDLLTIQAIASRKGNQWLMDQVNLKSATLDKKVLERDPSEGSVRVINVESGGLDSVSMLAGGGVLPGVSGDSIGDSSTPQQLLARPVSFVGQVRVPFDSARVVSGKADSIKLVQKQFELLGKNLGSALGRSLLNQVVCTYTAQDTGTDIALGTSAQLNKTASGSVKDGKGLRLGQAYDVFAGTGSAPNIVPTGSRLGRVRVTAVTMASASSPEASAITVTNLATFEGAAGATISGSTGASRVLVLPGSYGSDATAKFVDLFTAAGSGNLYGTAISGADWSGQNQAAATLTPAALRELFDVAEARSGSPITGIIMGRQAFSDLEQAIIANNGNGTGIRMYVEGDKLDPYGKNAAMPMFRGVPVCVDDLCPALDVYLVAKDGQKLGVWDEFKSMQDGKEQAIVSQTRYEYLIQVFGMFQGIIEKRNSLARFNITAF